MNHLLSFKLLATAITFFSAFLGGLWPLWRRQQHRSHASHTPQEFAHSHSHLEFPSAEAIAAGVFLSAGLLHMLADSARDFADFGFHYPIAYLIVALTFLILLGLEHFAVHLKQQGQYLLSSMVILTTIMLIIHSLLEGLAVGISTSFSLALIVFLAIIAHKSAASFALSAALIRSKLSSFSIIACFGLFICMTPLGILLGSYVTFSEHHSLLMPIFTAMAAGTFLYIGTLHGFERASLINRCCNLREFFLMITGFSVMAIVAFWT